MGGDRGSWPYQWHIDGQPPDFNSTGAWTRPYLGLHSHLSNRMDHWHDTVASNRSFSVSALAEHPHPRIGYAEPHGWFYCLPSFRQTMFPQNSVFKERLFKEPETNSQKDVTTNAGSQFPQKQFLVFDQTGDQTTMIFSSGVGTSPVHRLSDWTHKQADAAIFHPEHVVRKESIMDVSGTIVLDNFIDINKFDEDHGSDIQSEMHEDTEELDALMYSDDDTDSGDDEDEVTSTGHSPSTLTDNEKQYEFAGIKEEVASSDEEPFKRQKLSHGENMVAEIEGRITMNHGGFNFNDDTESHCGNGKVCDSGRTISLPGKKKRTRKDLVRETICTLQSIIPGGKGATPIEVIDEAINFLISLKLKAGSLGFDST